ncbi:MAG: lysoplasmalogenase family protein, partial [Candidatus Promineifilaceae bacterium]
RMWYCCTWRVLLAASDRLIGFITYEDTPPLFLSQSTTFGYISGAIFFVISDTALAFNRFNAPIAQASLIVLATYYLAQWLIALSTGSDHR